MARFTSGVSGLLSVIVPNPGANVMVVPLMAVAIASRSEPDPLSAALVTTSPSAARAKRAGRDTGRWIGALSEARICPCWCC